MKEKKRKPIAQIILTPVIDVVMILLLFFMIAYSRTSPQFYAQKVDLPHSSTALKELEKEENVEIVIDEKGNLVLNKKVVSLAELSSFLSQQKKQGVKKAIIRGDKKAPYQTVIQVIDQIKEAQIEKVLLLTQKKEQKGE